MQEQQSIKFFPPVIAAGSEPSINTKMCHKEALQSWITIHGTPKQPYQRGVKTSEPKPRKAPKIAYDTKVRYTYKGQQNHRREGSLGAAFVDWLIANPGATESDIKSSGHDLKHLRWDLSENRSLFEIKE